VPAVRQDLRHEAKRSVPLVAVIPVMVLVMWGAGVLVTRSRIDSWDRRFEVWLSEHRRTWLNMATEWGTRLAETVPVVVILVLAIIVARRRTHGWRAPVFLAVAVGGEKLIYLLSSLLVGRERPPVPPLGSTYATSSFPSGHVGSAITLYGGIALAVGAWRGRRALVALLTLTVVFTAIVAFSRMYCGFHYPSDCIAGLFVGVIWLTATWRVVGPLRSPTDALDEAVTDHPAGTYSLSSP